MNLVVEPQHLARIIHSFARRFARAAAPSVRGEGAFGPRRSGLVLMVEAPPGISQHNLTEPLST